MKIFLLLTACYGIQLQWQETQDKTLFRRSFDICQNKQINAVITSFCLDYLDSKLTKKICEANSKQIDRIDQTLYPIMAVIKRYKFQDLFGASTSALCYTDLYVELYSSIRLLSKILYYQYAILWNKWEISLYKYKNINIVMYARLQCKYNDSYVELQVLPGIRIYNPQSRLPWSLNITYLRLISGLVSRSCLMELTGPSFFLRTSLSLFFKTREYIFFDIVLSVAIDTREIFTFKMKLRR